MGAGASAVSEAQAWPRVLGDLGPDSGPTLVVVAGIHGNEPSGVLALRKIVDQLQRDGTALRGRLFGLVGNRRALLESRRYVREDLNRMWTTSRVAEVLSKQTPLECEEAEMADLAVLLEDLLADAGPRTWLLDIHSISGRGPAFSVVDDTLPNRDFAEEFPVPLVLGLEEEVAGTLSHFVCARGARGIGFEAGQHFDPASVDRAEAAIWIALEVAGVLPRGRAEVAAAKRLLAEEQTDLPVAVEVRYRHGIAPSDGFAMQPGFASFDPVREGDVIASDHAGAVKAPESGLLLMPLYQSQGAEGFFVVRNVRPFWLRLSAKLRRYEFERFLHWMPGVKRHPVIPETFLVDRRVARWFSLEIFHLLGFRRHGEITDTLVMTRRAHDHCAPAR